MTPERKLFLEKAMKVWYSPLNGNAVVLLRLGVTERFVLVGDLDAGERYIVLLSDLVKSYRDSEPEDFGFSWTSDVDSEILEILNS